MIVGTRVLYPEEVSLWQAEFLQISVYNGMKDNLDMMRKCVRACIETDIRYVIHPVGFFLSKKETFKSLKEMAELSDLALILHDEKNHGGKRLQGQYENRFRENLKELNSIASISFENSTDTHDIPWFWQNYADSITLDIGHVESSDIDSTKFISSLDKNTIEKIQFVHMHRNNGLRSGLTDHWPITPDCREVKALKELIKIKTDINVILEINEIEMINQNLKLLKTLK